MLNNPIRLRVEAIDVDVESCQVELELAASSVAVTLMTDVSGKWVGIGKL